MDLAAWCMESRVVVVAGKGGVGKTTVSATLAAAAGAAGLSVLIVDLEGRVGVPRAFGRLGPLTYEPVTLSEDPGPVAGRCITPDDALLEYLVDHGLERVSRRLVSSGVLDLVATAVPGMRDVLVLGKVKQLERAGVADLVVVDAPATGHAMTFLSSARGLLDAARSGPVRTQAADVVEMLQDPARCRVLLVTLPEELPVSETIECAYQLEDRIGVQLGPVVVNCYEEGPGGLATGVDEAALAAGVRIDEAQRRALDEARQFYLTRLELVADQVGRLSRELPLHQLRLPRLERESIGPAGLAELTTALTTAVGALPALDAP